MFLERVVLFRERPGVATSVAIDAVRYLLLAWFVAVAIAGIGKAVVRLFASGAGSLDAALIRLCFRILSITGALLVLLHAAAEFGIGITPIIAGLGVGGLAVALAIRPTLENIMGGFVLFADKPVRVGEFCSFGDKMGTVEKIGLRSTRVRGLDRTVITVPNSDFAQMQIVNYTRRDMNLFQCKIGLRYETTPDQLRYVAAKIRKLLIQHSKVSPDPARVRLSEFGDSAYVLEVFAFVTAADWGEFLAIKEDLNLRIAEIVRESGTSFAFPSQTVYFTRDTGVDAGRGEATEAEVRQWREEQRLPFPDFDFAERVEMEDTHTLPVRRLAGLSAEPAPKRDAGRPRGHTQAPRRLAGSAAPKPGTRRHLSHDGSPKAPVRSAPPRPDRLACVDWCAATAPRRPASPPAAPRSGSGASSRVRLGHLARSAPRSGCGTDRSAVARTSWSTSAGSVGVQAAHQPGAAGERAVRADCRAGPTEPVLAHVVAQEDDPAAAAWRMSSPCGTVSRRACATPHLSRTKCGNRGGGCCAWRLTRDQANSRRDLAPSGQTVATGHGTSGSAPEGAVPP